MNQESLNLPRGQFDTRNSPYVHRLPENRQGQSFSNVGTPSTQQPVSRPRLPVRDSSGGIVPAPTHSPVVQPSVTQVQVVGLHGGAGASRVAAYLSAVGGFVVSEVFRGSASVGGDGSLRLLVVSATDYGSAFAFNAIRENSDFTLVAAVEDGIPAPRVPHIAKARFKAISVVSPVVYVPFVSDWRYDSQRPASSKYKKSIELLVTEIQGLEKYMERKFT